MTKNELIVEIAKILKLSPNEVNEKSALGVTPSWDSFAQVEIIMFLEQNLSIEVNQDNIEKYTNLADIFHLVTD